MPRNSWFEYKCPKLHDPLYYFPEDTNYASINKYFFILLNQYFGISIPKQDRKVD